MTRGVHLAQLHASTQPYGDYGGVSRATEGRAVVASKQGRGWAPVR